MPPAARVTDATAHGAPLNPGPGSLTTKIGFLPAWRAVPLAAAAGLQSAKATSDATIKSLETATQTAPEAVSKAAAVTAETSGKAAALSALGSAFSATGADVHMCPMPSAPVPTPHGPGVVLQASTTVFIDYLPAARQGDKVVEVLGPPDPIVAGCPTVIIG